MIDVWNDSAPFRQHLLNVIADTQLPWPVVTAHAQISPRAARRLLLGRTRTGQIHCELARAIMQLDAADIANSEERLVPAAESRSYLDALHRLGWDLQTLPFLTSADRALSRSDRQACTAASAARIRACYDHTVSGSALPTAPLSVECTQHLLDRTAS